MRNKQNHTKVVAVLLAATAALTACGGDDVGGDGAGIDERELNDLALAMADANDLAYELRSVTERLMQRCMEDRGYAVHPETPFTSRFSPEEYTRYAIIGAEPADAWMLPEAEEAAARGFGIHERWEQLASGAPDSETGDGGTGFMSLDREYQEGYFEAQNGAGDGGFAPGGCWWEVADDLHGDVYDLGDPDNEQVLLDFAPPMPGELGMELYEFEFGSPELDGALVAFADCLEERGRPRVTAVDWSIVAYVESFYTPPSPEITWADKDGVPTVFPEPEGAPWAFEEARGEEIAFAVDVAECADETDLRGARQRAWDLVTADMARGHEADLYAWREAMEATLSRAQELLGA